MDGNEIRLQINKNNETIRTKLDNFILTPEIKKLLSLNEELRKKCPHVFKDGVCIYCDGFEEDYL